MTTSFAPAMGMQHSASLARQTAATARIWGALASCRLPCWAALGTPS